MTDWQAKRKKAKTIRTFDTPTGRTTSIGFVKPYNQLVDTLSKVANDMQHTRRKELQELAWRLGMAGETQACEAIMVYAKEPKPYGDYMYGVYGVPPTD